LHVGRRGRVLLFFGALDLIYAFSLASPDADTRRGPLFSWLAEIAPTWIWAAAWGVVGAILVWQAFCHRDAIGYAAAIGFKIGWGIVCLTGWLFGGVDRGYVSAAIWLAAAFLVGTIGGWPEPGDRKGPTWKRPSSSP
jgi:hypothetical protein